MEITVPDPAALALLLHQTRSLLVSHMESGISAYPASVKLRRFAAAWSPVVQQPRIIKPVRPRTALLDEQISSAQLPELFDKIKKCRACGPNAAPCLGAGKAGAKLAVVGDCCISRTADRGIIWGQAEETMLWRMMAAINLRQEEVYVTNAVKCSQKDELKPGSMIERRCLSWLEQELRLIQPKVICAMGGLSANALLGRAKAEPLHRLRAKFHPCALPGITASVMPTYHPRFLLRNSQIKEAAWLDLQDVQRKLRDLQAATQFNRRHI